MAQVFEDLAKAVLEGDHKATPRLVTQALEEGSPAQDILNQGLLKGMGVVGRLFREEEYYVPEVLMSARAMRFGMEVLQPKLASSGVEPKGYVAIGTVKGDLHDIGKDLVGMMLEGDGYKVLDLGKDVSPEKFVEVVREGKVQAIGLSALLTTTMENMRVTLDALQKAGVRDKVKVMIGGAPVTERFAKEIGADCYGEDAVSAVDQINTLFTV